VLGEEFGFAGVLVVLALFFIIIYRGIHISAGSHNRFGSFMCIGVATIIFFHVMVNLGMVVGLLPVTGVPLPFLSYGGSSFLMFSIMIGLLEGVAVRRGEY
jgi:cell division protein FtsW (lipid II flippase)